MGASYFSEQYLEAKDRFKNRVLETGGTLKSLPIGAGELSGPQGEPLTIDVGFWGPQEGPALVLSSGLHGIEGYCGSGIQLAAMDEPFPAHVRRVFVHAINPYGMAHWRRVNENNVDLNRNFIFDPKGFKGCSDGYHKLNALLNPRKPFQGRELLATVKTVWAILRHGLPALKQAVASGQYAYPQGLFFGGAELQESAEKIIAALTEWLPGKGPILHVDFHSGLGDFGDHALLLEAPKTSAVYREMHEAFGNKIQPWNADEGVAYGISGGFPAALQERFGARIRVLTCEYGTYKPKKVVEAMTAENRVHFYGGQTQRAKEQFKETFFPRSAEWRQTILETGLTVIERALAYLNRAEGADHE